MCFFDLIQLAAACVMTAPLPPRSLKLLVLRGCKCAYIRPHTDCYGLRTDTPPHSPILKTPSSVSFLQTEGTGVVHLTGFFNREYDPDLENGKTKSSVGGLGDGVGVGVGAVAVGVGDGGVDGCVVIGVGVDVVIVDADSVGVGVVDVGFVVGGDEGENGGGGGVGGIGVGVAAAVAVAVAA